MSGTKRSAPTTDVAQHVYAATGKTMEAITCADLVQLVKQAGGPDHTTAKYTKAVLLDRLERALSSEGQPRVVRAPRTAGGAGGEAARVAAVRAEAEAAAARAEAEAAAERLEVARLEVARLTAQLKERDDRLNKFTLPATMTPAEAAAAWVETENERYEALQTHLATATWDLTRLTETHAAAQREADMARDASVALALDLQDTGRDLANEVRGLDVDDPIAADQAAERIHALAQRAADMTRAAGTLRDKERAANGAAAELTALKPKFATLAQAAHPRAGSSEGSDSAAVTCLSCSEVVLSSLSLYSRSGGKDHCVCLDCASAFFCSISTNNAHLSLSSTTGIACSLAKPGKPCCVYEDEDVAAAVSALGASDLYDAAAFLSAYNTCIAAGKVRHAVEQERRDAFQRAAQLRRMSAVQRLLLTAAAKCPGCGTQSASTEQCEHVTCPVDNTDYGTCCCGHAKAPDIGGAISACIFNPYSHYIGLGAPQKEVLHTVSVAVDAARIMADQPNLSLANPSQEDLSRLQAAGMAVVDNLLFPAALEAHPARARVLSGLKDLAAGREVPILPRGSTGFINLSGEDLVRGGVEYVERHMDWLVSVTTENEWLGQLKADHCAAFRGHLVATPGYHPGYNLRTRLNA